MKKKWTAKTSRKWKRFFAVGCSHGHLADPHALETVLAFKKRWRPDLTIHLGDFLDLSPMMMNGKKAETDGSRLADDFRAGVTFLEQLEPQLIFAGNHEDRIPKLQGHSNSIISFAADQVALELDKVIRSLGADYVPYDIQSGWREIGDTRFGHGYMFSENALRDHAELVGNCVIAHLHKPGMVRARRLEGATGICVGTLANIPAMAYAKTQKSRTAWNHGFVFGEYCEGKGAETISWLIAKGNQGEWRLPI